MRNKFVYSWRIKTCVSGFDEVLESIFCLLLVVEVFSLKKSFRDAWRSGTRLARGQVNIVDENHKESRVPKSGAFELWCWRRLLRVPWTARRSKQPILKEISPGCSLGRIDVEAETPVLWPPLVKSWLIGKDSDWGQEEKGMTEDEMAGWHHWLDGCEFEWTPGVGDGQGGLACCDSWSRKESDTTERLNWTDNMAKDWKSYPKYQSSEHY